MEFINNNEFLSTNWKWLTILGLFVISYLILHVVRNVIRKIRLSITGFKRQEYLQSLLELPLERPITGLILTVVWQSAFHMLDLPERTDRPLEIIFFILRAFWLIQIAYMASEAVGDWLRKAAARTESTLDDQFVPMARRGLKILVVVLGILITLQNVGINVISLLAGLGLGGLALALAAQDTAANVFGSITILMDRPFQVGHFIKVGSLMGTVEDVGFRSTRIRTLNSTLVTIPNSTIAKEQIENFAYKTFTRFQHTLGITYDTSTERIEAFVQALRNYLSQRKDVLPQDRRVHFTALGDFNLQISVHCYFATTSVDDENKIREEVLLDFMKIAQQLDVIFAFPTQTLHIESLPKSES